MKHKVKGTALSMPMGLVIGLVISLAITLVLAALITHLVIDEKIAASTIGYFAMFTVLLSAAIGALVAVSAIKRRRLLMCLISGASYFLGLISITALFFGGQYQGMGVTALLVFSGAGSVALLGLRGEGRPGKRHKKHPLR